MKSLAQTNNLENTPDVVFKLVLIDFEVFETKFGYFTYSYEDYCKIKRLYYIFQEARRQTAKWVRWVRKHPQNRIERKYTRNKNGQRIGHEVGNIIQEPIVCDLFTTKLVNANRQPLNGKWFTGEYAKLDTSIEYMYITAKQPYKNKESVRRPKMTSSEINELLEKAESWYKTIS